MKGFTIRRPVASTFFALLLYYFIMELYFVYYVGITYDRFGFVLDINPAKYIETKLIFFTACIYSFFLSHKSEFIYSIFTFFVIFFLVPGLINYSHQDQPGGPLYSTIALMFGLGAIASNRFRFPRIVSHRLSNALVMALLVLGMIPIFIQFGVYFNVNNLLFEDIHDTRDIFNESTTGFINYLYPWLVKALVPILMVYFLIQRRFVYAFICLSILMYLYIISANKIVYITAFVMVFFYYFGRGYLHKVKKLVYGLVFALLLIPVADAFILGNNTLKGTFVMRMLFLPSHVNYYYFDFFKSKPLYYSESHIFNMFFAYPFDKPIGFVISETYFDAPDMNSNNGVISDGYMNLGYPGIVINILLIAFIFLFFNSTRPDPRYLGIFFVMVFLFLSVPMLQMFLTSGLWIIFLLSLTIMRERQSVSSS